MAKLRVKNMVCDGNSITNGHIAQGGGSQNQNAPPVVLRDLLMADSDPLKMWSVKNVANSGDDTQTRITKYDLPGGTRSLFDPNYGINLLTFFEGTNDFVLLGLSVDASVALLKQYATMALYQGWTLQLCTAPPTTNASAAPKILQYNTWLRSTEGARYSSLPVLDLAGDSRLSNPANTSFYQTDGIHPNLNGYAVIAELFRARMLTL